VQSKNKGLGVASGEEWLARTRVNLQWRADDGPILACSISR